MMESLETGTYENHQALEVPLISADHDSSHAEFGVHSRTQIRSASQPTIKQRETSQTSAAEAEEGSTQETPISTSSSPSCNFICKCKTIQTLRRILHNPIIHKLLSLSLTVLCLILLKKLMKPSILHSFFIWMEDHPLKGLIAYLILYPLHMVLILPGTPLIMGAGFVFKLRYGWLTGVTFCSIITLLGSLIGSIICFLLGRFCFRNRVRRWSKKYPLFEPIDGAVADHGFRVMVLVYLTPAVPLGPMSYMMGTTSMALMDFAMAKIAALPMTVLYVYLGAATGTLMTQDDFGDESVDGNLDVNGDVDVDVGGRDHLNQDGDVRNVDGSSEIANLNASDHLKLIDENHHGGGEPSGVVHKANFEEMSLSPKLIAVGMLLTVAMIAIISIKMKQELQKILDKQNKESKDGREQEGGVELKNRSVSPGKTRQRHHGDDNDLHQRPRITNKTAADNV